MPLRSSSKNNCETKRTKRSNDDRTSCQRSQIGITRSITTIDTFTLIGAVPSGLEARTVVLVALALLARAPTFFSLLLQLLRAEGKTPRFSEYLLSLHRVTFVHAFHAFAFRRAKATRSQAVTIQFQAPCFGACTVRRERVGMRCRFFRGWSVSPRE